MSDNQGNADFWIAVATISPLVLVAFAATMPELQTQNSRRRAQEQGKSGNVFLSRYIPAWVVGAPVLGGGMTIWAAIMLASRSSDGPAETGAVIGLVLLMVGQFSAGIQLWRFTRGLPDERDLLAAVLTRIPNPPDAGAKSPG